MQWLETFVNTGTTQIQTVSAGVHQLCSDLGHPLLPMPGSAPSESDPGNPDSQSAPGALQADAEPENRPLSLLESLKELLEQTKERQDSEKNVIDGVGELIGTLREEMARSAEMRDVFCELFLLVFG